MRKEHELAPLASYAPLPPTVVQLLDSYMKEQNCETGMPFHVIRSQTVNTVMQSASSISTTWLIRALQQVAPGGMVIERKAFPKWRRKGSLRQWGEERPSIHSTTSLLLWRRLYRGERMMRLAPSMTPEQPLFYVFVQLVPGSVPMMAAYPFPCERDDVLYLLPQDAPVDLALSLPPFPKQVSSVIPRFEPPTAFTQSLEKEQALREQWLQEAREAVQNFGTPRWCQVPPTALLYSPYAGLALHEDGTPNPNWLLVDGGVIRFFGSTVSLAEIAMWEIQVARLNMEDERLVPAVVKRAKEFALDLLAQERLKPEKDAVPWQVCP